MSANWETLGPEGLAFFGRMCASVSHELKNSLALINENAGLIQDLLTMAERGKPLDSAMMATASGRVTRHVGKANAVIGNLNRFAHLADHPVSTVDLREEAALAVTLHGRLAAQREVELALVSGGDEVKLKTRPFLLANALHLCLTLGLDHAADASLTLEVAGIPGGAEVRMAGLGAGVPAPEGVVEELFFALGARVVACGGGELVLALDDLADNNDAK